MRCPSCDSPLPENAAFCIECGAPARAATDRTIQLEGRPATAPPPPPQLPAAPAAIPAAISGRYKQGWRPLARGLTARSGAVMLIGLGLLFLTGNFWPWILALVGVAGALEELASGSPRGAAQTLLLLVGMALIFANGFFWPWMLILMGLAALLDNL